MGFEQALSALATQTNLLWAAVVSAVVSAAVSYYFRRRETRDKLAAEYEYEQRKKLRDLIGRFHGRLLNAANSLNQRFWNLYSNHDKRWLHVDGEYRSRSYYFHSFVHRFLAVCTLIRQFEREAVFVDARIAGQQDFTFLKLLAALRWCMTDLAIFSGLDCDQDHQRDHFFADNFRQYCDSCAREDGSFPELDEFIGFVREDRSLDPVLAFFDGLSPEEDRLRWDRLVAFHLILAAFINNFGYPEQRTSRQQFLDITRRVRNPRVLQNLGAWLPQHGLGQDREVRAVIRACLQPPAPK